VSARPPCCARLGAAAAKFFQAVFLEAELGFDVVDECLGKRVTVEPVVVEPKAIVLIRGLQQPIDRRFAAALRVAGDVIGPESAGSRFAEIIA